VATVVIGKLVGELDRERADAVLAGKDPFDEATMIDEDDDQPPVTEPDQSGAAAAPAPRASV
jgi:aerobic C4-dicarboxylate transport protein